MVKHRGEIIRKAIEASGKKIQTILNETGIAKTTLYSVFEQTSPKLDYIIKIGKSINHDFSKDFPDLAQFSTESEDNLNYKFKYMELAEKYIKMMEENAEYMKKFGPLK